jgi:hypothetical protein
MCSISLRYNYPLQYKYDLKFSNDGLLINNFSCTLVLTILTRLLCINSGARHYVCEDMKIFNVHVYISRMVCAVLSLYSLSLDVAVVRR